MIRLMLSLVVLLGLILPASAHRLKVFAMAEGSEVTGYAFFIGGGRAQGTDWVATTGEGTELARGRTGPDGTYRFGLQQPVTSPVTVTVDTHEGHIASATLPPGRFGPAASAETPAVATETTAAANATSGQSALAPQRPGGDTELAALVGAAVQRQIEPLQERIEEMDARLRYSDIVSAVFLIFGLAGIVLYLRGRRG